MKEIQSTMTGTVLNVSVSAGDDVNAGDSVVMLESMKMEIPVEAAESGKIKEVKIDIGDFVDEGDVLIILE